MRAESVDKMNELLNLSGDTSIYHELRNIANIP